MIFGKCPCKVNQYVTKKEFEGFKDLLDLPRFESWIQLLQQSTNRIDNKYRGMEEVNAIEDLNTRVTFLENKIKNMTQQLRDKGIVKRRGPKPKLDK